MALGGVIVLAVAVHSFVYPVMGWILSTIYERQDMVFQSALDPREFPAVLNTAFSGAIVVIFYIWQLPSPLFQGKSSAMTLQDYTPSKVSQ